MTWQGKPRWNGKLADVNITGSLFAYSRMGPVLLVLENCDDLFIPLFSDDEALHHHMEYLFAHGLPRTDYRIKEIVDASEFLEGMREQNVRVMFNPQIVDEHHTRWKEVVYQGEEWKFVDAENN